MRAIIILVFITVAWGKPAGVVHDPMINEGLFEGDIMGINPNSDRNAVPRDSLRWPGGIIPFVIDDSLKELTDDIMEAMNDIMKHSCIRFVPRKPEHKHYVRIFRGDGCWAMPGYFARGEQLLSLDHGCELHATIIHELMHTIGFEHEHNRSDRDDYLIIHWDNIDKNFYHAFRKLRPKQNRLLTDFDFDSVMLYGQYTFSREPFKLKSMEAKDGRYLPPTYEKPGLSQVDIKRLKILYECKK